MSGSGLEGEFFSRRIKKYVLFSSQKEKKLAVAFFGFS
jgi:hypothetical protein